MSTWDNSALASGGVPVLEVEGLCKSYGPMQVLRDVSLEIREGEVVGLLGPNGAGKSTLIRALVGTIPINAGTMRIDGNTVDPATFSSRKAARLGVRCVYQELSLCSNLSGAENYFLRQQQPPVARHWRKTSQQLAAAALEEVFPEPGFSVNDSIESLTLAQQQMCEVAFAASDQNLTVLILDEPTSALPHHRFEQLRDFLKRLRSRGVGIIFVSHKLSEVREIADRVVILRGGEKRWEGPTSAVTTEELIQLLGGQNSARVTQTMGPEQNADVLIHGTEGLTEVSPIPFRVYRGEVVGVAGLEGAGQRPLLHALFRRRGGRTYPSTAYVSGDRQNEGVFRLWSIADNILISGIRRLTHWGLVDPKETKATAQKWFERFQFEAPNPQTLITQLSGGNQQKALIARGMASGADLILLDDPTRGVDVSTKEQIYQALNDIRTAGRAAVLYSTEDPEFRQCDRVYVMRDGAIVAELVGPNEISPENIIHWSYQGADTLPNDGQAAQADQTTCQKASRSFGRILAARMTLPLFLLVAILVVNGVVQPDSLGINGLNLLIGAALPLVFATLAQTFIMIAGDIDLGIGNALGLGNVIAATLLVRDPLLGWFALLLLIVAYGCMALIIHVRHIPSIVMTLGASFIWLGIALVMQPTPGGTSPSWLSQVTTLTLPGLPEPIYLVVAAALAGYFVLRRMRYGVVLRGFGNNAVAVVQSGWSGARARVTLYVLAGICVVIGALLITATSSGSDANGSTTYTLTSIAAAIVGGAEFTGGVGESFGVVVGALAFSLIASLLGFLSISSAYDTAVTGLILVVTLALRYVLRRRPTQ